MHRYAGARKFRQDFPVMTHAPSQRNPHSVRTGDSRLRFTEAPAR